MKPRALILTYHAVDSGPAPLFVEPALFAEHLDCLQELGAVLLTISEVAAGLGTGTLPERAVALTFDDGFASVAEHAAPLLLERGLRGTVFAVAGRLGATNRWPSQPARVPERRLADGRELAQLVAAGFELGSHGWEHAPLPGAADEVARRELIDSREALEQALGGPVEVYAAPYGLLPEGPAADLLRETYAAACGGGMGVAREGDDVWALPRVDIHYLRRTSRLARVVEAGSGPYLAARAVGARLRRRVLSDHAPAR